MVRKRRKVVNGVEITLLEKTISATPLADAALFYQEIEESLKTYVTDQIFQQVLPENIQTTIEKEIQTISTEIRTESFLTGYTFDQDDFLDAVSNDPEEGSILSYDAQGDALAWRQSTSPRLIDIENKMLNYNIEFTSDHIKSNKFHLPYAVKWTVPPYYSWGGPGKAGIFWIDPWDEPAENFSIKMGYNNADLPESGYNHPWKFVDYSRDTGTGFYDYEYDLLESNNVIRPNSSTALRTHILDDVTMRSTMDAGKGRGWAWTRWGNVDGVPLGTSEIPVMSLTNFGQLTVDHSIVSNRYASVIGQHHENLHANPIDLLGAFHIIGYDQSSATGWSGTSIVSFTDSDLTDTEDGYVLTYEHAYFNDTATTHNPGVWTGQNPTIGHLRLKAPAAAELFGAGFSAQTLDAGDDGNVMLYDYASDVWYVSAATGGAGGGDLDGLTDVTISTPAVYETLTYTAGAWQNSTVAQTYVNTTPMPEDIHDIAAGTTWNDSIFDVLTAILYPYQYPAFTSFSIAGQTTTLEIGDSAATGSITFSWATSNGSNVSANTVDIRDATLSLDLETDVANDGSETASYYDTTGVTKTTATSNLWTIDAQNSNDENFSRNYTVSWRWRFYWGSSATATATESMIEGLQNDALYSTIGRTYACDASNYKWICYPTSFGTASSFTDADTGFPVAMQSPETVNVTNTFGVATDYYAYRTTNTIVASLNITVA